MLIHLFKKEFLPTVFGPVLDTKEINNKAKSLPSERIPSR